MEDKKKKIIISIITAIVIVALSSTAIIFAIRDNNKRNEPVKAVLSNTSNPTNDIDQDSTAQVTQDVISNATSDNQLIPTLQPTSSENIDPQVTASKPTEEAGEQGGATAAKPTSKPTATSNSKPSSTSATASSATSTAKPNVTSTVVPTVAPTIDADYDSSNAIQILLKDSGTTVVNNNGGVRVASDGNVYVTKAGEYEVSGSITNKSLIVEMPETDKATFSLKGVSITSSVNAPISILSGDKVEISAKSGTTNTITDNRTATSDASGGAIDSSIDLEIKGKGTLNVTAKYNNGIDTKKDLEIKNLTLKVNAPNNALKGNDSVMVESGNVVAISSQGDGIKTDDSDVSSAGNRRGIVTIAGGTVNIYAACDGIDAAYDAIVTGGTLNIYTDSFSNYSEDVTTSSSSTLYIKFSSRRRPGSSSSTFSHSSYKYSVKFTLEDGSTVWKNASSATTSSNPGSSSAYYEIALPANAKYLQVFVYSSSMSQGQASTYSFKTDTMSVNNANDTLEYSSSDSSSKTISFSWTNYTTQGGMGGMGGMGGGNPDSAEYSCKGIKADNSVKISGGVINIKSHDDAIHANNDVLLADGTVYGAGLVDISGSTLTLYCNDDGIHGDGTINISAGKINIQKSYEGVEAPVINIKGGTTHITSSDDALNANASNASLNISGGVVYFNAGGDGIDSNNAIVMSGGAIIAQGPSSGGNGVIDYDRSFNFKGGLLLVVGANGMNQKPTASSGNTVMTKNISTSTSSYVTLTVDGEVAAVLKITKNSQNYCVAAFNNAAYGSSGNVTVSSSTSVSLTDGLYYVK